MATIDYKEKYEQALERARQFSEKPYLEDSAGIVEYIFPELAERDDERIRKELICFLDAEIPQCEARDKYIAWLEKQGDANKEYWRGYREGKKEILDKYSELEGQGEQKPCMIQWKGDNLKEVIDFTGKDKNFEKWFKSFEEYEKYVEDHNGIFKLFNADGSHYEIPVGAWIVKTPDGYNVASKAKYKQPPVDKVEPKFEVEKGKWYICIKDLLDNYANKAFRKGDTYLSTQDGSLMPSNSNVPFEVVCPDTYFRDWAIQDAKDGDVLVSSSGKPFIFKGFFDNDPMAYGGLVADDSFWPASNSNWTTVYCKPATKEQRDLLFQKMKEAGYKWDAEKKELKKIEQPKLTEFEDAIKDMMDDYRDAIDDNAATVEEVKERAAYLLSLIPQKSAEPILSKEVDSQIWQIANNAGITYDQSISLLMATKKAYDKGKEDAIKEQKLAEWSEEDENNISDLCSFVVESYRPEDASSLITWLKSIKDRVQPQNKTYYWTENEIKFAISDYIRGAESYEKMVKKLRRLKPQSQWKPSEEQINCLSGEIAYKERGESSYSLNILRELLDELKKLRGE